MPEIADYIKSRNLENQYKKAKSFLLDGFYSLVDFKIRQPKKYEVYQFRISKKYRAFGIFRETNNFGNVFVVTEISDHQDY